MDLSDNISLEFLFVDYNPLYTLNLSDNSNLKVLQGVFLPDLILLDVKNNQNSQRLSFSYNSNLIKVDARNGNNTNFNVFSVTDNPNLECVLVDDSVYANSDTSWYIDIGFSFREYCVSSVGFEENPKEKDKVLLRIIDILGRETNPVPNVLLFYLYKDGTVEKKLIIE